MNNHLYRADFVKGRKIGRTIGFPTFNFTLVDEPKEKFGVYVCNVIVEDKVYPSVCNWGTKPTLNDMTIILEAHVLGAQLPAIVPGDSVHVQFVQFLRNTQAFQGLEQLKKQLEKDKADALTFMRQ